MSDLGAGGGHESKCSVQRAGACASRRAKCVSALITDERPALGVGTRGTGHGTRAGEVHSQAREAGRGREGERRPGSQGHGKCACWGKNEKSCRGARVQGCCPGQGRAATAVPRREQVRLYRSTCNNVGECRSWEVAARGEWPSGRVTSDQRQAGLTNGLPNGRLRFSPEPSSQQTSVLFCQNGPLPASSQLLPAPACLPACLRLLPSPVPPASQSCPHSHPRLVPSAGTAAIGHRQVIHQRQVVPSLITAHLQHKVVICLWSTTRTSKIRLPLSRDDDGNVTFHGG